MSDQLQNHLKNNGYKIEDLSSRPIFNGFDFDVLTTNPQGQRHYFAIIDQKESNDVYSPKGEINRKIDMITRLMRVADSNTRFGIAVPNNNRYKNILSQKLQSISETLDAYLVGDDVESLTL
jgi:hypothetical protein